jgi:DNA replication protein DnaC
MSSGDSWRTPIEVVRQLIEKWDATGQLPKVQLDQTGEEALSSKLLRTQMATLLERRAQKTPERTGPFRAKTFEEETPQMRAYLIECRKRQAQLEGRPYLGPEAQERTSEVMKRDIEIWNREAEEKFHSGTPEALRNMGLDDLELNLLPALEKHWGAVAAVEMFLATAPERRFLVLGGQTGTGKTIAAASALLSCVDELKTTEGHVTRRWTNRGLFMKASELARLGKFGAENVKAWERLAVRKLLVIDDLGAEVPMPHWNDTLGELIDARMRGEVKTIVTTNLPGKEMRERYGARLIRRLGDYGSFVSCQKPEKKL